MAAGLSFSLLVVAILAAVVVVVVVSPVPGLLIQMKYIVMANTQDSQDIEQGPWGASPLGSFINLHC